MSIQLLSSKKNEYLNLDLYHKSDLASVNIKRKLEPDSENFPKSLKEFCIKGQHVLKIRLDEYRSSSRRIFPLSLMHSVDFHEIKILYPKLRFAHNPKNQRESDKNY